MRLSDYPVVFTGDSQYFFTCDSKTIRILSVETGQVVRTLSASVEEGGHSDNVTCVMLNPKNPLQLYSSSLDGTVKVWDYNDSVLLHTHNIGVPITHMVAHESIPDVIYFVTTKKSTKGRHMLQSKKTGAVRENSVLLRYSLTPGEKKRRLIKTRACTGLAISPDGEYLILAARYKLHVIHIAGEYGMGDDKAVTEKDKSRFRCYIVPEKITCLQFHPTEGCIATGNERGVITLWYCFGENEERPITTTMHWHAHAVSSLAFTSDGTYLLSGGEESVLVIWQLSTGHKQFLPRLGSEIKHITVSPDQRLYALSHRDNSINVVRSVDLKLKTAIQGLKFSHVSHILNHLYTGLVVEPRNGNVVLNGLPGTLQFYDPIKEQHIMELEVTPRNMVSRTDDKEIIPPCVTHCTFSNDKSARWMATVDSRDDQETTTEMYIKFWEYNDDSRTYNLNTRVDRPHTKPITSCVFNPRPSGAPMVVTTSLDGTFKVWELRDQGESRRGIEADRAWVCRSSGFYRDMAPSGAAFSSDGSILAIAYGHIITLWNPTLNTLQGVLVHPPHNHPVNHLTFLKDSPFLVAATKDHIYLWNLLSCTVIWDYKVKTDFLTCSSVNSNFLVSCSELDPTSGKTKHQVLVFSPLSSSPLSKEVTGKKTRAVTFLPDPSLKTAGSVEPILIMNHSDNLEILGGSSIQELKAKAEAETEMARAAAVEASKQKTLLTDTLGKAEQEDSQSKKKKKGANKEGKTSDATRGMATKRNMVQNPLFDTSAHLMAPLSTLYEAFMAQLLNPIKKETGEDTPEEQNDVEKDESEEQPNDVEMESVAPVDDNSEITPEMQLPETLVKYFSTRLTL
ncbi:hypothetical protein BGW38_010365 [Lunasporangiospora selenospora]|uniref:WD repeat-containing protein 75 second beta-propeller domain-containing protein n=1 Tax=Lunasporangiospora selenospora TaxID=979761 RepID=A0A9P6KFR6_9FUNG|nr:hypothetical protein BGW38_010365 [Lunasporangiospora selenospora]